MRTAFTGNGIGFARIECDNTINLIRSFTCKLFSDRLCNQLLLLVWVLYIINRQYSIGRYLFKPTCVRITNNDAIVRISHTYTATICIWYKSPTKNIHLAFILLHGCPLYHTCLAVHTCIYHRIALFHPSVYIITYTLNHAIVNLLGIDIVDNRRLILITPLLIPVHKLQCGNRILFNHRKHILICKVCHLCSMVFVQVLRIVHFLRGSDVVSVKITVICLLFAFTLNTATGPGHRSKIESTQIQRTFHIIQYGCFLISGKIFITGNKFRNFTDILIGSKVKCCLQRLPYFFSK